MTALPPDARRILSDARPSGGVALPAQYERLSSRDRARAREQYIEAQRGLCWHCGFPLDTPPAPAIAALPIKWHLFPPTFMLHPVHLHHSHETGLTIGAVHALCNAVLWQYHGE